MERALAVNDQFVVPVAVDIAPESTFHVIDDTEVSSDAVPDIVGVSVFMIALSRGDVIISVGGIES